MLFIILKIFRISIIKIKKRYNIPNFIMFYCFKGSCYKKYCKGCAECCEKTYDAIENCFI